MIPSVWRAAQHSDDDLIVEMCLALNSEDPGQPVSNAQIRVTLGRLRQEPLRGCAVVAVRNEEVVGYALLISFWSNEYGGEICIVDELYVRPPHRSRGIGTALLHSLRSDRILWPNKPVALGLETTPGNIRAREFYKRLGFVAKNQFMHWRAP